MVFIEDWAPQIYISRLLEAFIMMIMIYSGANKATTSLKRARRQSRELGCILKWWLDWGDVHSIVKLYGEMGKDLCPSLIQLHIENTDSGSRKDGRRKLISVFNNRHRKGELRGGSNFGFKFNRPVKILNVNAWSRRRFKKWGSATVVSLVREGDECQLPTL